LILVGDSVRKVSTPDSTQHWISAVVSPDGQWAAVRQIKNQNTSGLYRVELATGRETPLLPGRRWWPFSWSRDGRIFMLLADTITQAALAVETKPAAGAAPRTQAVFPPPGRYPLCNLQAIGMSDDGELALCWQVDLNSDVYIVDDFGAKRR